MCSADCPCQHARPAHSRRLSPEGQRVPRPNPRGPAPDKILGNSDSTEPNSTRPKANSGSVPREPGNWAQGDSGQNSRLASSRVSLGRARKTGTRSRASGRTAQTPACAPREARTPRPPPPPQGSSSRLASPPPSRLPGRCPRLPRGRRAAAASGVGRAEPSRGSVDLVRWDVAKPRGPELRPRVGDATGSPASAPVEASTLVSPEPTSHRHDVARIG